MTSKKFLHQFWTDTGGQDLVEYALAAGMVAVAAVAVMPTLSTVMSNVFSKIGSIITSSVNCGETYDIEKIPSPVLDRYRRSGPGGIRISGRHGGRGSGGRHAHPELGGEQRLFQDRFD